VRYHLVSVGAVVFSRSAKGSTQERTVLQIDGQKGAGSGFFFGGKGEPWCEGSTCLWGNRCHCKHGFYGRLECRSVLRRFGCTGSGGRMETAVGDLVCTSGFTRRSSRGVMVMEDRKAYTAVAHARRANTREGSRTQGNQNGQGGDDEDVISAMHVNCLSKQVLLL
jgi:hypothetical protein